MSLLLETICIADGAVQNIELHNARFNRTRSELFGENHVINLANYIRPTEMYVRIKCRVIYNKDIVEIKYEEYIRRDIRTLKLIDANDIDYSYKYHDRSCFDKLLELKSECDDILIVKNGLITDTSFSNVALKKGEEWHTPAKPLLAGVQRQKLINQGKIIPKDIAPSDLPNYSHIRLINAMIDMEDGEETITIKE